MEDKKISKKAVIVGLAVLTVAIAAVAVYIGAFVLERAPKIEASPSADHKNIPPEASRQPGLSEVKGLSSPSGSTQSSASQSTDSSKLPEKANPQAENRGQANRKND